MRKFTIVGSRKMIIFDDMDPKAKVKIFDKGVGLGIGYGDSVSLPGVSDIQSLGNQLVIREGDTVVAKLPDGEPLKLEQQHFFDCVARGTPPLTDGQNGLQVLRIMEAAQTSLDKGGVPIEIKKVKNA
jgi:predicted dehydrogenase